MHNIRLVTFDILHTLIRPRLPIHVQYCQVFTPYLGALEPEVIKTSFKSALKAVQTERPSYNNGAQAWWTDVIRRTALGAGANEQALKASLPDIVSTLMTRFGSREGYEAFEDVIPTIQELHNLGILTAVISNGDSRMRSVIQDLQLPPCLNTILLSEEEGIEKPSKDMFMRALQRVRTDAKTGGITINPSECLHIGDELVSDYEGARNAGMKALLLHRLGSEGERSPEQFGEQLRSVHIIHGMAEVIERIKQVDLLM